MALCYNARVMSPLTRMLSGALAVAFALGLVACEPRAAVVSSSAPPPTAQPTAASPQAATPTPTAAPTAAPTATAAPSPSPPPTAAPTAAPAATAAQGGSMPRPSMALRRLASWGDGVPAALALSPDGADLYVATALRLRRHDAGDLARVSWDEPVDEPPVALALSPDGATLAVARGKVVELRDAAAGTLLATLGHDTPVADVAYAPDGATIAAALAGDTLTLWDAAGREPLRDLRLPQSDAVALAGPFTSVAYAPDGLRIAAGDLNGNLAIWSASGGPPLVTASVGLRIVADVAYSPDGATIAAASEGWRGEAGAVWLFDPASGAERGRLTIEDEARLLEPVERLAFAADGGSVVAGTAAGAVLRWSWPDGALIGELAAHRAAVSAVALAPGGGLVTAGRDGDLRRWNGDGARIDELDGMPAVSAVAAGAGVVATGGEDGSVALWEQTGAARGQRSAHTGHVNALATSPDGALLASAGDDGAVRLWGLPDGMPRGELLGHEGPVLALAFAPGGALLASAGWDGTVRLWGLPAGEPLGVVTAIKSDGLSATAVLGVALDDSGRTVAATAYDGVLRRYKVKDGAPLASLATGAGGWLIAVAATPGGHMTALDDAGLLWAWGPEGDPAGREALADATALAALPDGRLLSVGPAGGLRLWSLGGAGPAELASADSVGDRVAPAPDGALVAVSSRRGFVEVWGLP